MLLKVSKVFKLIKKAFASMFHKLFNLFSSFALEQINFVKQFGKSF